MIADALVAGTKLMTSQFVTFAAHPLGVQQIFLKVFSTPQSCFREKSIENCRNMHRKNISYRLPQKPPLKKFHPIYFLILTRTVHVTVIIRASPTYQQASLTQSLDNKSYIP